jgi:predicted  nucleic acid-binding Zn-ribbon protein
MEVINKIETQISELENRQKRANDLVANIVVSMKNLRKEKTKSQDEFNAISGAIQAFKGVLAELNKPEEASPHKDSADVERQASEIYDASKK